MTTDAGRSPPIPISPRAAGDQRRAVPFLKWAGGKQQLLAQLAPLFPQRFERYFEPFLGSGAVYFHLWRRNRLASPATLSDSNEELINSYLVVRDRVDELLALLDVHQRRHSRDYYYQIRRLDRQPAALSDVERAARTIYLNRTCYNGLYRVNRKGEFNVPIGSYAKPQIARPHILRAASQALQGVRLLRRSFTFLVDEATAGDFIYFDPPYHPVSATANFTSYTAHNFGEAEQERLASVYRQLTQKGCLCMLSNSHTPFILDLYRDFRLETVQAGRAINSQAGGRGPVSEAVVLNYDPGAS